MEIKNIKVKGYPVVSIYNAMKYYFVNFYYGIIAIADIEEVSSQNDIRVTLRVGNKHTVGSSIGTPSAVNTIKQFIKKEETKFISKQIEFVEAEEDLSNVYITIEEHSHKKK